LERAVATLARDAGLAAVTGRRRERDPAASIYNLLCDIEWDTPVGDAEAFGGDVLLRKADVAQVGGYDETLIAGEDPDLSQRLKGLGRRIERIDAEMTLHDAAMHSFKQWWKRNERAGHAYAEGARRHAATGFWAREVKSNWLWGAFLPAFGITFLLPTLGASLFVVAGGYGSLFVRVRKNAAQRGLPSERAVPYAAFTALGKLPQALGQAKYWWARRRKRRSGLIEYK
jgi:hypothetical protein